MAHLSWMLKHIMCMHYFKQVASTYIPIPTYHMHIKHGQASLHDYAHSRMYWRGQNQFCFVMGATAFSRPYKQYRILNEQYQPFVMEVGNDLPIGNDTRSTDAHTTSDIKCPIKIAAYIVT